MDGSFACLVRRARQAAWMTQVELAERSCLSPRTIQAIERGQVRRPHRESVHLLADALGLHGVDRAVFETAARQGDRRLAGDRCDCREHPCPALAEITGSLVRHLRSTGPDTQVDLHGLGHTADPATVLARLLRALGVDRDTYGLVGSLVPSHTPPVRMLPGA
jgi:transcriptional regulator with XRE-family HTH domain